MIPGLNVFLETWWPRPLQRIPLGKQRRLLARAFSHEVEAQQAIQTTSSGSGLGPMPSMIRSFLAYRASRLYQGHHRSHLTNTTNSLKVLTAKFDSKAHSITSYEIDNDEQRQT